jgi:hypothetical protein
MVMKSIYISCILSLFFLSGVNSVLAIPAFPGAEGFGVQSVGGRGGTIYEVTNLDNSGTGYMPANTNINCDDIVDFYDSQTAGLLLRTVRITVRGTITTTIMRYRLVIYSMWHRIGCQQVKSINLHREGTCDENGCVYDKVVIGFIFTAVLCGLCRSG